MPGLRRRTLLRALLAGSLAGGVAGCNGLGESDDDTQSPDDSGGDAPTPPPGSPSLTAPTAAPSATGAATPPPTETTPGSTPTPAPTATAPPTPSPAPTPSPTPDSETRTALTFVERFVAGEFDRAHDMFTDGFATDLTAARLERYFLGLTAQHGAVEHVADVSDSRRDGTDTRVATLACAAGRGRVELAVADGRVDGLWFPATYSPPDYVDQSAVSEREVTVDAEGCPLPATLSMPDDSGTDTPEDHEGGAGPVPGVVLVHGSGPNDRDETVGPNKPFRDLAWGLASRGVAVLRYEKRTAECDVPLAEWDIDSIVVDDALRALETLRGEGVRTDATVVVGHSLGGTCTPRILARDDAVAGGAMLAANARPITEVSMDQVRHYFRVVDGISALERGRLDRLRAAFDRLESGGYTAGQVIEGFPASWWTSLLDYDQVATARSVDAPLFLAQGGRDFQVLADADFGRWRSELADRPETRFERYPALSHLFHPGTEPSVREEYAFHDNVAERVVADLAAWVDSVA